MTELCCLSLHLPMSCCTLFVTNTVMLTHVAIILSMLSPQSFSLSCSSFTELQNGEKTPLRHPIDPQNIKWTDGRRRKRL